MDTKIIAIVGLIIGIVALGSYYHFNPNTIEVEKVIEVNPEVDLAILDADIYGFYEDIYDSSTMFYDYTIYNYGNGEAKNIEVTCKSWDENGIFKFSLIDNYGNLASKSYEFGEVTGNNKAIYGKDYISGCYIESCDNCKILMDEIPELSEEYRE